MAILLRSRKYLVKTRQHDQFKTYREHFYTIKLTFSNKIRQKSKLKIVMKSIQRNYFTRYFGEKKACYYTSSDPTHFHILILSCLRFSGRTKSVTICSCANTPSTGLETKISECSPLWRVIFQLHSPSLLAPHKHRKHYPSPSTLRPRT